MKKLVYLALLLIAFKADAQKGVVFKIKYLPNRTYNGVTSMTLNCRVNLSGNDTVISKLQQQGITVPVTADLSVKIKGNIKTGSMEGNGTFPMTANINFDDMDVNVNGKHIPVPMDKIKTTSTVYGHVNIDGKLRADSVGGQKLADTTAEKISQTMEMIQKSIKFPDHPMKPGETFTQDMPMNLPIAGNKMNLDSKVIYKLARIEGGNAYFDVQQSMDFSLPVEGKTLNLSGGGTGKMVYSIKDHFATNYETNMDLKFTGEIKTLKIDAGIKMGMGYKFTIN